MCIQQMIHGKFQRQNYTITMQNAQFFAVLLDEK